MGEVRPINGCVGPRVDDYDPATAMSAEAARDYYGRQLDALKQSGIDTVAAIAMTNVPEAVGIARAARDAGLHLAISFTLEPDGRLPTGDDLGAAIATIDAVTGGYPDYYTINCADPSHFAATLNVGGNWLHRVRSDRRNCH